MGDSGSLEGSPTPPGTVRLVLPNKLPCKIFMYNGVPTGIQYNTPGSNPPPNGPRARMSNPWSNNSPLPRHPGVSITRPPRAPTAVRPNAANMLPQKYGLIRVDKKQPPERTPPKPGSVIVNTQRMPLATYEQRPPLNGAAAQQQQQQPNRRLIFPAAAPVRTQWPKVAASPSAAQVAPLKKDIVTVQIPRNGPLAAQKVQQAAQQAEAKPPKQQLQTPRVQLVSSVLVADAQNPLHADGKEADIVYVPRSGVVTFKDTTTTNNPRPPTVPDDRPPAVLNNGAMKQQQQPPVVGEMASQEPNKRKDDRVANNDPHEVTSLHLEDDDRDEDKGDKGEGDEEEEEEDEAESSMRTDDISIIVAAEEEASPEEPLEWYTKPKIEENSECADESAEDHLAAAALQGAFELEIEKGRIKSQTPGSDSQGLITVMHRGDCVPSLAFDINYINKLPADAWNTAPARRNERLRSASARVHEATRKRKRNDGGGSLKRKWRSLDDMDMETATDGTSGSSTAAAAATPLASEWKRQKLLLPDLQCDESIAGNSSDDLTDGGEPTDVSVESVIMPEAAAEEDAKQSMVNGRAATAPHAETAMDAAELPVMQEGDVLFNTEENTLEATTVKVRECFRPAGQNPEPIGFNFLHWKANVGVLFGSNLSFYVNEVGLLDVKLRPRRRSVSSAEEEEAEAQQLLRNGGHEGTTTMPGGPGPVAAEAAQPEGGSGGGGAVGAAAAAVDAVQRVAGVDSFWDGYMEKQGSFAAPKYLFPHTMDRALQIDMAQRLQMNMQVELVDPLNVDQVVLGTVSELLGGRVGITVSRVYGVTSVHYFNKTSWMVWPVGTAARLGLPVVKPAKETRPVWAAYKNADLWRRLQRDKCELKPNMQLEAFDWRGSGALRPASVYRVIGCHVLVVFDDDPWQADGERVPKSSFWCRADSPLLRPPYYHEEANLPLLRPKGAAAGAGREGGAFKWRQYVKRRGTSMAPSYAFHTRATRPFREGMQLEVVDLMNPQVMRPATVRQVLSYEIRVQYDGFPQQEGDKSFDVWLLDDSEDMFPVGWGLENRERLVVGNAGTTYCKRVFCGDVGHKNPTRLFHAHFDSCPYEMPGFRKGPHRDPVLAARFAGPKLAMNRGQVRVDKRDEVIAALERKVRSQAEQLGELRATHDYGPTRKRYEDLWERHMQLVAAGGDPGRSPFNWSCEEVQEYIDSVPQCRYLGSVFVYHEVDGEALLSLTERDLVDIMGLKQGVVLKIYNAITQLRRRVSSGQLVTRRF